MPDTREKAGTIKRLLDTLEEVFSQVTEEYADVERIDAILTALHELDPLDPKELDPQEGLRRFHARLAARSVPPS